MSRVIDYKRLEEVRDSISFKMKELETISEQEGRLKEQISNYKAEEFTILYGYGVEAKVIYHGETLCVSHIGYDHDDADFVVCLSPVENNTLGKCAPPMMRCDYKELIVLPLNNE